MKTVLKIDGKEIEISEEDKDYLLNKYYENSAIFDIEQGDKYYFIDGLGNVCDGYLANFSKEGFEMREKIANACKNEAIMNYRALNEALNRLLWRFSYQNGWERNSWAECKTKCYLVYEVYQQCFVVRQGCQDSRVLGAVYFISETIAEEAIKEVAEPFYKQYPELIKAQ